MSSVMKIGALIFCIQIFMYFGVSYGVATSTGAPHPIRIQGDLFDYFLADKTVMDTNLAAYDTALKKGEYIEVGTGYRPSFNFSGNLEQKSGEGITSTGFSIFSILDGMKIVWAGLMTVLNIMILPLTMFSVGGLPPIVAIMLGMPLTFLGIIGLWFILRGVGS